MNQISLRDCSNGALRGWPGGWFQVPGGIRVSIFRPARNDEEVQAEVHRSTDRGRWTYCKYCYCHVLPLVLREFGHAPHETTEMVICASCGSGLTAPELVLWEDS